MDFGEALNEIRKGEKVHRKGQPWYYTLITTDVSDTLITVYSNGNAGGCTLTAKELLANDWEIFRREDD